MKFFEFKYDSRFSKFFGMFLSSLQNLLYPQIYCLILLLVLHFFNLTENWPGWISLTLFGISILCGFVLMIRFWICKKGVFLYDSFMAIERYSTTLASRKMDIQINYHDIKHIYVNYQNLRSTPNYRKLLVMCGARDSYVELTLRNGKQYFFALENQEEFCNEVRLKLELLQDNTNTDMNSTQ